MIEKFWHYKYIWTLVTTNKVTQKNLKKSKSWEPIWDLRSKCSQSSSSLWYELIGRLQTVGMILNFCFEIDMPKFFKDITILSEAGV